MCRVSLDGFIADADDQVGPLRYFGPVYGRRLLQGPHTVIQGDRVLHRLYRVSAASDVLSPGVR